MSDHPIYSTAMSSLSHLAPLVRPFASASGGLLFVAGAAAASALLARREAARGPPVAKHVPHLVEFGASAIDSPCPGAFGPPPMVRTDPLFWLRDDDRADPEVLAHIKAENDFTVAQTAHLSPDIDALYAEMLSRVKETDAEVPVPWGPWLYYSRTIKGQSYPLHCRRPRPAAGVEPPPAASGAGADDVAPPPDEQARRLGGGSNVCLSLRLPSPCRSSSTRTPSRRATPCWTCAPPRPAPTTACSHTALT